MVWESAVLSMIGGMGLLLYGMSLLSDGLQKIAGKRLREALTSLTKKRLVALGLGTLITVLFQSSTATTVILVSLTSAQIITLRQTLAVILGADIGTTITAQLIALKVTEISLPVVGLGAVITFYAKTHRYKRIGQVLIGFGLLFLGLKIMADTMYPLKNDPMFAKILLHLSGSPVLALGVAAIFTFLVASSAATIGIIMLLAMQHLITLEPAIYMLFGANIGTAFTAVLSSIGSSRESQRVATAHLLFKVAGVLLFIPFVSPLAKIISSLIPSPGFRVANMHTFFNVAIATLFLPFINQFARLLELIVPEKKDINGEIRPKYLDETLFSTPELAIGMAAKEIMHVSDHVMDMAKPIYSLLKTYDPDLAENVKKKENDIDILVNATNKYLTRLLRQQLTRDEFNKAMGLIHIIRDYEYIGDVIEKNILYKAEGKYANNVDFSAEGHKDIITMHNKVIELLHVVNTAFATNSCMLAEKAKSLQEDIVDLEFRLRMSHIARLQKGAKETENTTFIHMDVINAYLRISEHLRNIAMALTDEVSCTWHDEALILTPPSEVWEGNRNNQHHTGF
ncbi:Na/Pi-cotransporter II-related protein [Desulfotomaculum nigrificans CO-1-SRB]|uniref:Na/Pi-cotransporter II-related protein n=1 Tax=Desulfotomaculum nigrificans (strain DSM 14880 / VKM B-2319 / CO-1-SRB) TaxID=868595 RepID=F6B7S9_DESCC|nr:Na/Pi symporter [Desulfotomaculum nigrificans]AEF93451.1 Na/Pi-cotransporter II-related protein [Desulfotomaculum nigrificans CO-1-SRB]